MAIGGAATCAKIMLFIVNIVFTLTGLLLFAIGVWLLADPTVSKLIGFVVSEQSVLFRAAAGLVIAMGILVIIIAVLGFIGAVGESAVVLGIHYKHKEYNSRAPGFILSVFTFNGIFEGIHSPVRTNLVFQACIICLLLIYIGLLGLVFCGEISAGVIAIAYQDKIINQIVTSMSQSLRTVTNSSTPYYNYNGTSNICSASPTGESWDTVQIYFKCCGVGSGTSSGYSGSTLYLPSICPPLYLIDNKPMTCCLQVSNTNKTFDSKNQTPDNFDCTQIYSTGCADAMVVWVQKYAPVLIGIGLGIAMFQMVVVIFALCLCQHREKDHEF